MSTVFVYDNWKSLKGDIMITPEQSRAARGLLDWSQSFLAKQANLGESTIRDYEKGRRIPSINNLAAIKAAFEVAGVAFIPENGGGAGVRLAKPSSR
jgi:transcriptional regulator with XRE-family HTH domain